MTKIIAFSIMIIMILSSAAVFAEDTRHEEDTIADLIAVRPAGFASLAIGTGFFIASLPFAIISGSTDKAAKALVADPFNYTFTRPFGDFDSPYQIINEQNKKDKDSSK